MYEPVANKIKSIRGSIKVKQHTEKHHCSISFQPPRAFVCPHFTERGSNIDEGHNRSNKRIFRLQTCKAHQWYASDMAFREGRASQNVRHSIIGKSEAWNIRYMTLKELVSSLARGRRYLFSTKCLDSLCQCSHLLTVYQGLFHQTQSDQGMAMTTHTCPVRNEWSCTTSPLHALPTWHATGQCFFRRRGAACH